MKNSVNHMKKMFRTLLIAAAAVAAACAPRERTLVLLSTNDMHAKIQNFPRLAAAVGACRDTAQLVVLVDAGDRSDQLRRQISHPLRWAKRSAAAYENLL